MVRLLEKQVSINYAIEVNEYELDLLIEGLTNMVNKEAENSDLPCITYTYNFLQELKKFKNK